MEEVTIHAALQQAVAMLTEAGNDTARLDASLLLAHVTGRSRESLLFNGGNIISYQDYNAFMGLVGRRACYEPLAYITGIKEFWSLDFLVTCDTLIPRPDSETLIEAALRRVPNRAGLVSILDIGTGTGCLLISLLKELPAASGVGIDNNESALQVARRNALAHNVEARCRFVKSHWCDALNGIYDLIISNPPYIALAEGASLMPDVVQFEPHEALFAGADGLDAYRVLAPRMPALLAPGGLLVWEVGQEQAGEVMRLLEAQGLAMETPEKDLSGIPRCVIARNIH